MSYLYDDDEMLGLQLARPLVIGAQAMPFEADAGDIERLAGVYERRGNTRTAGVLRAWADEVTGGSQ